MIPSKKIEMRRGGLPFLLGRMMWKIPLRFGLANLMGSGYCLRCVLFHDVADEPSPFTQGLGSTLSRQEFENVIQFLSTHYTPVGLSDVLGDSRTKKLSRPPVLVTFDDAYASVAVAAAPILRRHGVPAIFFVNASAVGNQDMQLDNLICYVVNTAGVELVCSVARQVAQRRDLRLNSLDEVFMGFLAAQPQPIVQEFRAALASAAGIDTSELARRARLNVNLDQLRSLVSSGFEIGNHTYSHVFCRSLRADDFDREIVMNKTQLETMTGRPVRSFSVPYGNAEDLTDELLVQLRSSGHEATFLVESSTNTRETDIHRLNRVSVHARTNADLFTELEVLPRLRSIRNRLAPNRAQQAS
jgi:peptidoglycan/xylan/chitin deacetylase (PgdA/CDA1 family)